MVPPGSRCRAGFGLPLPVAIQPVEADRVVVEERPLLVRAQVGDDGLEGTVHGVRAAWTIAESSPM